jgi:CRP-like cAMP-binding protein
MDEIYGLWHRIPCVPAPVDLLKHVPLFEGLGRKHLEQLAGSFKERTFNAGDTVAEEGKSAVGFFVIESGEATVSVRGQERAKLHGGDYFGEIATITADTDLHCYGLTSWDFRPLVERDAGVAWQLLQALAKKLRAAEGAQT